MGSKLSISSGFCFLWALSLLLLPLRWAIGALLAAIIHETAHFAAILLSGGHVCGISLNASGAVMETVPMTPGKEVLWALAGPMGSFSVLLMAEYFPEAAVCALIQGAYNLIPVFPLDGGRVIRCLFSQRICRGAEVLFMIFLMVISLWMGIHHWRFALIFFVVGMIPMIRGKLACKEAPIAVQ